MSESTRNLGKGLAASFLGFVFAVVMIEAIPRLLPGVMPKKLQAVQRLYDARNSWEGMMRGDRELGFVLQPGLDLRFPSEGREIGIRTSELSAAAARGIGFRDIGTSAPYQAIALGDSFTFCDDAPAETCWVRRLSEDLGISIATLGVNGYSNLAEARLLEKVLPSVGSKLVIVAFFPNDFKDNLHFHNWTKSGTDDYWTWMRRKRRSDTSDMLARNSVLYRLVDAARRYRKRDTFEYKEGGLDFLFRADAWWRYVLERPGDTPGYHLTIEAFEDMAATTRRSGARLVVLLFPFKEQVYWDIAREYYADLANMNDVDIDAPVDAVRTALHARGIDTCNLVEDLRAEARERRQLYLKVGAHWTDEGNRAAADAIAKCLHRLDAVDEHSSMGEVSARAAS